MPVIDTDTDEGKAEIQKMIEKETAGLKAKRDELLSDLKKQKDSVKSVQDQLDELKAAKEAADAEAAAKSGDVEKIKASIEAKYGKERDALMKAKDAASEQLHRLLIDNGLTEALTKAGVAPQYLEAARALIKTSNKAEIADIDGQPSAMIGGKAIGEFVSEWSQGDNGKHFVAAPANSGGGANGSNGRGGASVKGDLGGSKAERVAAIKNKFPDLQTK